MNEGTGILVVLVVGSALGWISYHAKVPNAIAQVILGVTLGAAGLGWVGHGPILHWLGVVGVVLLLGLAGLDLGIERLKSAGWSGVAVAVIGIVLCFAAGYATGLVYGSAPSEALYLGLAMSATSIGISVQVLQQLGLTTHRVAQVVIAAAVLDDVVALYLLAATHGSLSGEMDALEILQFIGLAIVALAMIFLAARALTTWVSRRDLLVERSSRMIWITSVIAISALISELLGLSAVVGGFFAGLGIGEAIRPSDRELAQRDFRPWLLALTPFFFVMIGVQAQWDILLTPSMVWLVLGLIALGVIGKTIGGVFGAPANATAAERWLIGLSMTPRGEIALVIATLGYEQGHVSHHVLVALILVTITLSLIGPLLMMPFARQLARDARTPGK